MAVITSTRIEALPQKDGSLAIREVHIADGGEREERIYLTPANADLDAMLVEGGRLFLERLATSVSSLPPPPDVFVGDSPSTSIPVGGFFLDQVTGNLYQRTT